MGGGIVNPDLQRPQPNRNIIPLPPQAPIQQPERNMSPLYNKADWEIDPNSHLNTFMKEYQSLFDNMGQQNFGGYNPGQAGMGQWSPGNAGLGTWNPGGAGLGEYWSNLMGMGVDEITKNLQDPKYSQQMGVIRDWTTGAANAERDRLMDSFASQGGRSAPQAEMMAYQQNQAAQKQAPLMKQGAMDVWQNAVGNMMGMEGLRSNNYSDAMGRELSNADLSRLGYEGGMGRELQNAGLAGEGYSDAKNRELQNANLGMQGYLGAMPYQANYLNSIMGNKLGAFNTLSGYLQNASQQDMQAQGLSFNNLMHLATIKQGNMDINRDIGMGNKAANQGYQNQQQQWEQMWGKRQQPGGSSFQQQPVSDWLSR